MKIIGKQGGAYLVNMTEYEIAQLYGFSSIYSDGWSRIKKKAGGGLEGLQIDSDVIFARLDALRFNETKVQSAISTFRALADTLEIAWPPLKKIAEGDND